jgi:diguanylate cyclase (GGDEF)-like protein
MSNRIASYIRKSFSAKIITLVVLNVVVTSAIIGFVTMKSTENFLTERISEKLPSILLNSKGKIELWYTKRAMDITVLSKSFTFLEKLNERLASTTDTERNQAENEISKYFHYVKEQFPFYEELAVLSPQGELLVSTSVISAMEVDMIKNLREENEGRKALSKACLTPDGSSLFQWLLVPIQVAKNTQATICARLALKELTYLLDEVSLGPGGDIFLLNFRGCFLSQSRVVKENVLGLKAMEVPTRQEKPMEVERYNNFVDQKVLGSKVMLPEWNWWLVCEEDFKSAMAPVFNIRQRIFLADLIILSIFVLAALRLVRPILKPIRALAEGAKKIKEGMVGVKIEIVSDDEIGLMSETFNEMAEEIALARVKLQANNKELNARNEDLEVLNIKLEELSVTDGLTGLYNHRHFWNLLNKELIRVERTKAELSLILIDLDDFKNVNDKYGHPVGDLLLQSFTAVLKESVREMDVVARYGGEEFAVMLPETDEKGAMKVAQTIRLATEKMVFKVPETDITISITASLGVTVYDGNNREFFNAADKALYLSKDKGKNCVSLAEWS